MIELMQKNYNCKGTSSMLIIRITESESNRDKTTNFKKKIAKDIIGVVKKFRMERNAIESKQQDKQSQAQVQG